ncbi:MAG: hypothetical protein ACLFWF_05665 [Alphaproteobacteria bacterium]
MPPKSRQPGGGRRNASEFVRRAADQGESRLAVPHASLKRRAEGLMKQPLRTDLFRPASQPHEVEEGFVCRTFNFVEGDGPVEAPAPAPQERARKAPKRAPADDDGRVEPRIDPPAEESEDVEDDDLDLPPAARPSDRPLEPNDELDFSGLEEYDGSDLFDQEDPDESAEPVIPASERTELPSALRNRRNYFENSDQARKGGLLGGIIPGSGRPAAKPAARPSRPARPGPKRR